MQRVDGLEDLQTQLNQLKVNVGMPSYRSHPEYLQGDVGYGSTWDDQDNQYGYGGRGKGRYPQEYQDDQYRYGEREKGGYPQDEEAHPTDRTNMTTRGGPREFDTGYGTATDTGYGTATGTGLGTATDTQMGMIPEDKESYNKSPLPSTGSAGQYNGKASPKPSLTPRGGATPSQGRTPQRNTPTRSQNNTPGGTKGTPKNVSQSRNNTPGGTKGTAKTPSQSRNNTPGGAKANAKANSVSRRNSQDSLAVNGDETALADV